MAHVSRSGRTSKAELAGADDCLRASNPKLFVGVTPIRLFDYEHLVFALLPHRAHLTEF
jgi:hypothetical protein